MDVGDAAPQRSHSAIASWRAASGKRFTRPVETRPVISRFFSVAERCRCGGDVGVHLHHMSRRTQIMFTDRQHALLLYESSRSGLSMAELVRRAVDRTFRP